MVGTTNSIGLITWGGLSDDAKSPDRAFTQSSQNVSLSWNGKPVIVNPNVTITFTEEIFNAAPSGFSFRINTVASSGAKFAWSGFYIRNFIAKSRANSGTISLDSWSVYEIVRVYTTEFAIYKLA